MKAAQSKTGKKLFSNEKTGREILKRLHEAGRKNPHIKIKLSIPSDKPTQSRQLVLREG